MKKYNSVNELVPLQGHPPEVGPGVFTPASLEEQKRQREENLAGSRGPNFVPDPNADSIRTAAQRKSIKGR